MNFLFVEFLFLKLEGVTKPATKYAKQAGARGNGSPLFYGLRGKRFAAAEISAAGTSPLGGDRPFAGSEGETILRFSQIPCTNIELTQHAIPSFLCYEYV